MRRLAFAMALSVALWVVFHGLATWERGYEAIGGELLVAAMPIIAAAFQGVWERHWR